ncbi:MAG: transcription elongation factor GreA [Patescibacteria group bacterium]
MRLPTRKSQQLKLNDEEAVIFLTPQAIENMKRTLVRLEKTERPQAVTDLTVAVAKGDLSENAEYTEAKGRLGNIDGRIFSIKDRLKRVVAIERGAGADGNVRLGATVRVEVNGKMKTYEIVGPTESDPSRGRISHVSPLGQALVGHGAGETVMINTENGNVEYKILDIA